MKAITNPTLIKGIFRELSALRVRVYFTVGQNPNASKISISDDLSRAITQLNYIQFEETELSETEVNISFELDGTHYQCELKRAPESDRNFLLPDAIYPQQRRKSTRSDLKSLSRHPIVVEIRGKLWRSYGYLKDTDMSHLSIEIPHADIQPKENESVAIRAYTQEFQILSTIAQIKTVRSHPNSRKIDLLLDPYKQQHESNNSQRHKRSGVESLTFLELFWPDLDGLRIRLEIYDVTPTGFSAISPKNQTEFPPKGGILRIGNSEVLAQLKWQKGNQLGFDLSINTRQGLTTWNNWVDEWRLKILNRTPEIRQRTKIAKVLIRSGYLRDFKASAFSAVPELLELIPNNKDTKNWLKRFFRGTETEIDAHISFARCTDTSWIIQELGNSAIEAKVGDSILKESIEAFYLQELPYITYGLTLLALFDPLSKFNQKFWMKRSNTKNIIEHECRLIDLRSATNVALEERDEQNQFDEYQVIPASNKNWTKIWRELQSWLPERTQFAFGFRADDYSSSELRQVLSNSGYHTERHVDAIYKNGTQIGLCALFGVPTFSNLNATTSHLWIFLKDIRDWKQALAKIFSNGSRPQHLGCTESVLISPDFNSENIDEAGFSPTFSRRRKIQLIPISELAEFLKEEEST